jgi:hypothetical protein
MGDINRHNAKLIHLLIASIPAGETPARAFFKEFTLATIKKLGVLYALAVQPNRIKIWNGVSP